MEVGQGPNWCCSAKGKKYINPSYFRPFSFEFRAREHGCEYSNPSAKYHDLKTRGWQDQDLMDNWGLRGTEGKLNTLHSSTKLLVSSLNTNYIG
jgi:hypothetical protein